MKKHENFAENRNKKREKRSEIRKANKAPKKEKQRAQRRGNALFFCLFAVKYLSIGLMKRRTFQPFSTRFTQRFMVFHDVSRERFLLKNERRRGKFFSKIKGICDRKRHFLAGISLKKGIIWRATALRLCRRKGCCGIHFFQPKHTVFSFCRQRGCGFYFFQPKGVHL